MRIEKSIEKIGKTMKISYKVGLRYVRTEIIG